MDPTEAEEDLLEVTVSLVEETALDINVVERIVGDMVGELVDTGEFDINVDAVRDKLSLMECGQFLKVARL